MNSKYIKYILLAFVIVGVFFVVQYNEQITVGIESWVKNSGDAGPFVFMLIYIVGTVFFLPGSVLTLAGGALFGPVWGTLYNLTGATIGAIISFITARYIAKDFVEKKSSGHLNALREGVDEEGWKFVAFVRLVPIFPFNVLNYALGLTKIKLIHYSIATYVCMLPGAIAYTYIGYVGREAISGDEAIIQKILLGIALLAIVSFMLSLIKKLRKKQKE